MSTFVDKRWQEKGIDQYSNEAILATLAHYGITQDLAALQAEAAQHYPMHWARNWFPHWKGLGQFSRFPGAAAQELWRRFRPEALAPTDLALALIQLLSDVDKFLVSQTTQTLDTRFKVVTDLAAKMPPRSVQRDEFMEELVASTGEWMKALDIFPYGLAQSSRPDDAQRLIRLDEQIFEVREGISSAIFLERTGKRDEALAQLNAIAANSQRHALNRLHACEVLFDVSAQTAALDAIGHLIEQVAQQKQREWGSEIGSVLLHWNEQKSLPTAVKTTIRDLMDSLVKHFDTEPPPASAAP
jgi:hypothetical protein